MQLTGLVILIITFYALITIIKIKKTKYSFEKELRKCESPIEVSLMKKIHAQGLFPYSQIPCGKYRIDIALFINGKRIAIECDGEAFHSSLAQLEHDERKNRFLEKNKWRVLRFSGKEIYHEPDWCVQVIKKHIKK